MTGNENFESRLLTELRQVSAENPEPVARPAQTKRYGRLAVAGTGLAAVVAAIAIYASTGSNTPSAYAVETKPDGMVSVEIKSLKDADGLEKSLLAAGIPADVDYSPLSPAAKCDVPGGSTEAGLSRQKDEDGPTRGGPSFRTEGAPPAPAIPASAASDSGSVSGMAMKGKDGTFMSTRTEDGGTTFSIDPGHLKPGEKVYITTSSSNPGPPAPGAVTAAVPSSIAISIGDKPAPAPGC